MPWWKVEPKATTILQETGDQLKWVKVGLQSYLRDGPDLLREIAEMGKRIFLDLKLHDIPNTMSKALESLSSLPISMLTLHATAGPDALAECAHEAKTLMPEVTLLAVTVLTSMDEESLSAIGVDSPVENQVIKLAKLAAESGIGGIVCSPLELRMLRPLLPSETKLVTPGIRPSGSDIGDQKRIMTPGQAPCGSRLFGYRQTHFGLQTISGSCKYHCGNGVKGNFSSCRAYCY